MQIQNGKLYENRTWKYLYPCLQYYGENLTNYLSSFVKLAIGINDTSIKSIENSIFILLDTRPTTNPIQIEKFKAQLDKFLDWLKYQSYYVTDYMYDAHDSGRHMIVLKVPNEHSEAYLNFVNSMYSHMYSKKEINSYFSIKSNPQKHAGVEARNKRVSITRKILERDPKHLTFFVKEVNKMFNTSATTEDFKEAELDFPVKLEEEIFNYGK